MSAGGFNNAVPGFSSLFQSSEADVLWGQPPWYGSYFDSTSLITSGALDSGNSSNTSVLRPGLVMGKIASTGKYTAYAASNTDGSQQASAVLLLEVNMLDPYTGAGADRYPGGILVSGPVKAGSLIGLDQRARSTLGMCGFLFDDDLTSGMGWGWRTTSIKTAAYQVLITDQNTLFIANGSGSLTFTLPAITVGQRYLFLNYVAQNMVVTSTEGTNIVCDGNVAANTITYSTSSHQKGSFLEITSEYMPSATLCWVARNIGSTLESVT